MKPFAKNRLSVARLCAAAGAVILWLPQVSAEGQALDIQAFLPLLERNSIAGKIIDVSVTSSLKYQKTSGGSLNYGKQNERLLFDARTKKYREERKLYENPTDPNDDEYRLIISVWDGKKHVELTRFISKMPGHRALGQGIYEMPGGAIIKSYGRKIPSFVEFYFDFDKNLRLFTETVPEKDPRVTLSENTVTIETEMNQFVFSRKTGALERLLLYAQYADDHDKKVTETWDFSNHVERSGVWIPLKIVTATRFEDGILKTEQCVDPKTLRLLDAVEDESVFNEALPAGCGVLDEIRKISYTVTTADTLPNDVEALTKTLDKMLERVLEQKEEAEKEMREKRKEK